MAEVKSGLTRRDMLKRGAVLGASVAWATPVVQLVGMRPALAQTPSDVCIPDNWADLVVSSSQGTRHDGLPIEASRSNPDNALGPPDDPFFSLGFKFISPGVFAAEGGVLIVRLAQAAFGTTGAEAVVVETTGGDYPNEVARVDVSQNAGGPWTSIGFASNDTGAGAVQDGEHYRTTLPLPPGETRYIRLTDVSNPADFTGFGNADGFDVNAVGTGCPVE